MKKNILIVLLSPSLYACQVQQLPQPPNRNERHLEIITQYNDQLPPLWNNLTPPERVFAYYMTRASIPGNRIYADQTHRHAVEITHLFRHLIHHEPVIAQECATAMDVPQFMHQTREYATYLFAHHNQYFVRENENHKRTPARLGLSLLTPENVTRALRATGAEKADSFIAKLRDSLFNTAHEPTLTVSDNIQASAMNLYGPDVTQEDYEKCSDAEKASLLTYFFKIKIGNSSKMQTAKNRIGEHYTEELSVVYSWLLRAYAHTKNHPQVFSTHTPESLRHMLNFLMSGNEEDYKQFYRSWIKIKDRVSFNIGFTETYLDPKNTRGAFEADVTVQAADMQKLNQLLPQLERKLPFQPEFMRQNLDDTSKIPNAAVYAKIFAAGELGPIPLPAAYCLPNYEDIRATDGSRQVLYQTSNNPALNKPLSRSLSYSKEHADWLDVNDPQHEFGNDLWDIRVLLHETLGHGSGRLATHTFAEGDRLEMMEEGNPLVCHRYQIGDTIPVTNTNFKIFIEKDEGSLEELRADIMALYTSIFCYDELANSGFYKAWPQKIGKQKLIEWFITSMARDGLRRLLAQKDDAQEMVQAHARANNTILNYLLDHGGVELVEETYKPHTVIDVKITNLEHAIDAVRALAAHVQTIKSTANGQALKDLMQHYGAPIRNPHYIKILKENRAEAMGDIKEVAEIYPHLMPVRDANGVIKDVSAEWPESFLEQQFELSTVELSKV